MMKRPDPMIASKPGAEDTQAMAARTLWKEELYFLMAVTRSAIRSMGCLLA